MPDERPDERRETHALRPELPPLPIRMRKLPVDKRGYPVPWFVGWVNGEPEFRALDARKFSEAVRRKRCWVCGEPLGVHLAFVVGPMCAVNRISSEPPSHRECARFSAIACPFLSRPHMRRREGGLPDEVTPGAGQPIRRNPGVSLLWITKTYRVRRVTADDGGNPGVLFEMGDPSSVECYAEGRVATSAERAASLDSGLPTLRELAERNGPAAVRELERVAQVARRLIGAEVSVHA